jgi:TPR repeat protein
MRLIDFGDSFRAGQSAFFEGNYAVAESILRVGAEQGHSHSQCMFGLLHELGAGAPKDLKQAVGWYQKAAA